MESLRHSGRTPSDMGPDLTGAEQLCMPLTGSDTNADQRMRCDQQCENASGCCGGSCCEFPNECTRTARILVLIAGWQTPASIGRNIPTQGLEENGSIGIHATKGLKQ